MHHYFIIEPNYTDGDSFCNFTIGSGRVRANIQIYADEYMLKNVAWALTAPELDMEYPQADEPIYDYFGLYISVIPTNTEKRIVRFRVYQNMIDDEAPFTADIRFWAGPDDAAEFSRDLLHWLKTKNYALVWKPG